MVSAQRLSEILHTLYATSAAPELWPQFLQQFSNLIGVSGAAIVHHDMGNRRYALNTYVGLDPAGVKEYENYYGTIDEWRAAVLRSQIPEGELFFGEAICNLNELSKTEFFNDFLLRFDSKLFCGVETIKRTTKFETISLYQRWKDKAPEKQRLELLYLLLPHLRTALSTRQLLVSADGRSRDFEAAFNNLEQAIVLLDSSGICVFVNREAQAIVDRNDGLSLCRSRLWVFSPTERGKLDALVKQCCSGDILPSPGGSALVSRATQRPLRISVRRFRSAISSVSARAVAIAILSDPDRPARASSEIMAALFGFTAAECKLADLLVRGLTLKEVSDQCQIKYETARSQLKSVFNKAGVRRQAELVQLILTTCEARETSER